MFWDNPQDRLIGLGLIALGAVAYYLWGQRDPDAAQPAAVAMPAARPTT
jgi:hypothetical protein